MLHFESCPVVAGFLDTHALYKKLSLLTSRLVMQFEFIPTERASGFSVTAGKYKFTVKSLQ